MGARSNSVESAVPDADVRRTRPRSPGADRARHDAHRSRRHRHGHRHEHRHARSRSPSRRPDEGVPSDPSLKRDDWMSLGEPADDRDGFGAMGAAQPKAPAPEKPDPETLQVHARELNPALNPASAAPPAEDAPYGGPGHKWRMMKLQRTYEMAEQSGTPVEQVAMERYGSMEAFDEARSERQYLDDTKSTATRTRTAPARMSDTSVFRRPGEISRATSTIPATPEPNEALRIPSVLPHAPSQQPESGLDVSALNKLEAAALRAEMAQRPEAATLRAELERAKRASASNQGTRTTEALPVLDSYGRMYDLGTSTSAEIQAQAAVPRKNKRADTPTDESLAGLVRQERLSAGSMAQKDGDAALAYQISTDRGFENDLDYIDDEAQRFSRKKMRDDAMKRQFAVQDFAQTKRALDECTFCWQDDGRTAPRANIVSSGTCVYLALPDREPLVEGHCWIVPMHHHVSSLDVDEDGWTEIRNFMKCLIRQAVGRNQTMVFFETVRSLREQKHTYLEAVPIPNDAFQELPAYFKTALADVESEWTDHAKLIYFSEKRPFQHSMVSRLPYFMIQWDYKGQRGYGHVIESLDDQHGYKQAGETDDPTYGDGDHLGGSGFPKHFAHEIIGSLLDVDPLKWRRPRHVPGMAAHVAQFRSTWAPFDWTATAT